jgi:hypothetical protein
LKLSWKIAVSIAAITILSAATALWLTHRNAVERKLASDVQSCRARAEQGNAVAEYDLAVDEYWGKGVPQDYRAAAQWFRKAADQGNAKSQGWLGYMSLHGLGVEQSNEEALRWYHKAADQGDARAEDAIGSAYYYGRAGTKDYAQAALWYRKAADLGLAQAQYDIGYLYEYGRGMPQDRAEAQRWYRKAADHGNESAQRALGLRTCSLTTWRKYSLFLGLIGGLLLSSNFRPKSRNPGNHKSPRQNLIGPFVLFVTGMEWFQCSKYGVFPSAETAIAFKFATMFLYGVIIVLLLRFVLPRFVKFFPILAAILFVVLNLSLCAIVHFDLRVLTAFIPKLLCVNASPLGIAITSAFLLWRARNHPEAKEVPANEVSAESTDNSNSESNPI